MIVRSIARLSVMIGLLACVSVALGAPSGQDPYIGYVYPAGGQQGSVFHVTIRGQRLRTAASVYVSGAGVHASVTGYESASGPLNKLQQEELKRRLQELRETRTGGANRASRKPAKAASKPAESSPDGMNAMPVTLPDLPELRNLDQLTPRQLQIVANKFLNQSKRPKPPIAEEVSLEVTIDPNTAPGDYELRLRTTAGLTNPVVFQVGQIPEIRERDKYEEEPGTPQVSQPPVVLNGQILPGEVDRFPLQLRGGQKLVVAAQARKLIPYLADAVPGWFQAVVQLYDPDGKEIAFADECGFDPDPAFTFEVPRDGQYTLAIRDALYRGREDFVYRVDIAEPPLIKSLFPLGNRGGVAIGVSHADRDALTRLTQEHFGLAADSKPSSETEPNDTAKTAMSVTLPRIVSGCIARPGDRDVFGFEGRAGQQVVAEVFARRMGSPLDSLVKLVDANGKIVASNDDHEDAESGLLTHHADSYLSANLPVNGYYTVYVSDAQGHGGPDYNYSLRIGPPQPGFALRVTPSCLNVPAGRSVMSTVYAIRKDGWDGDINVAIKDAPEGLALSGGRIPKGRDKVRVTLTAPVGRGGQPIALQMEGSAQIGGKTITRPVVPAEDMEQAFAYHHLVPSQQLIAMVTRGTGASPSLDMAAGDRLRIPSGGSAQVSFVVGPLAANADMHIELSNPPAGVTLQNVSVAGRKCTLLLKADDKHVGYSDNLIVEAFTEQDARGNKTAVGQKQRVSLGVLPAVPFEITKP